MGVWILLDLFKGLLGRCQSLESYSDQMFALAMRELSQGQTKFGQAPITKRAVQQTSSTSANTLPLSVPLGHFASQLSDAYGSLSTSTPVVCLRTTFKYE
jgi:hypothetical protein